MHFQGDKQSEKFPVKLNEFYANRWLSMSYKLSKQGA